MAEQATQSPKKYYAHQYWHLFQGLLLLLIGVAFLLSTPFFETLGLWFPLTAIIVGVLMVAIPGEIMILGFLLLIMGASVLLHETGLITVPYLRNFLGWILVILGGLMIFSSSKEIIKKYRSKDPDPEYYPDQDVDY